MRVLQELDHGSFLLSGKGFRQVRAQGEEKSAEENREDRRETIVL